jgi:CHAD domain-containing protein
MPRLKSAQGALGNWHDCLQWLAMAEQETDLQPCVAAWKTAMAKAEGRADRVLDKLSAACFKS